MEREIIYITKFWDLFYEVAITILQAEKKMLWEKVFREAQRLLSTDHLFL